MAKGTRGKLGAIPADHDVLGHPSLRDKQGGGNGVTQFAQKAVSDGYKDITKSKPTHKGGDFKYTPGAGV